MKKTPVQVYLEPRDRSLLERLARRLGLSRAETIREALRRWAADVSTEEDRLLALVGCMDDPALPVDLSTRHDEYATSGYPRSERGSELPGRGPA